MSIANPDQYKPLRLIVGGTAGSGNSYLINCLLKSIRQLINRNKAVQVLCPTGNSANIISGVTLHIFLKIPTSAKYKEMSPPDGVIAQTLQRDGVEVLLVDERSLIGFLNLGWMEFMCRCGMNKGANSSESWCGLRVVVFFGDDVQLPPVCDCPVYNCTSKFTAAMHGHLIWKEFSCAVNLQTIVGQDSDQETLKNTLTSMREYKTTLEQARWLQQFQWNNLKKRFGNALLQRMQDHGLFVFPTHADEWQRNKCKLMEANTMHPIAKIDAITEGRHSKVVTTEKSGGLVKTLCLCKGAMVTLTVNLNVPHGLFNGAMDKVVDILYLDGRKPKDALLDAVMTHFPTYSGPPFVPPNPKVMPIVPAQRRLDCNCHGCKRTQIPLRLGWGTTIHRCQGMAIGEGEICRYIVIHPGCKSFESRNPGALFVALSLSLSQKCWR